MRPLRVLFLACSLSWIGTAADSGALDRYLAKPEPVYKYELAATIPGNGFSTLVVKMTSQTWRTPAEVNHTDWWHWLVIVKPDEIKHSTGFLFIEGGSLNSRQPTGPDRGLAGVALQTKSVVAQLRLVPNEPLKFPDDSKTRTEDEIIAYTWDKFLKGGDEFWPLHLPMAKSAVKAMDTITAVMASEAGGKSKVDRFVVAGASKRGWTTWLTAAGDKRVVAVVPIVIDCLNNLKSFHHHWQSLGYYSPAIEDYVNMKIPERFDTKRYQELLKIEDPYSYIDKLTMPKLVLNAAGDQYFLNESSQFYFHDLKGEKLLRYVPNADHSMRDSDALQTVAAFYGMVLQNSARPKYSWKLQKDGSIRVQTQSTPKEVRLWQAANEKSRDFRLLTTGKIWKSTLLAEKGKGVYEAKVEKPAKGWAAFFIELTYEGSNNTPLKLTTDVRVVPFTLPYPPPKPGEASRTKPAESN